MSEFKAVAKNTHAGQSWHRFERYDFARSRAVVPLVVSELSKASVALPIGLMKDNDSFVPVAVLSLDGVSNVFVAPDGRWLGRYVPAELRGHPFALLPNADGKHVLCVDESSSLLKADSSGEPFFDEAGEVAEPTRNVMNFLRAVVQDRVNTANICAALEQASIIVPWDITLKTKTGDQKLRGLYKIDEAAFNALSTDAFIALREASAISVIYCQLLSMQHLSVLGRLTDAHTARKQEDEAFMQQSFQTPASGEIEIDWDSFTDDGSTEDTK